MSHTLNKQTNQINKQ